MLHPLYMAYSKTLQILVSRKFLVLLIAAWLLHAHLIQSTEFLAIALAVLGIQGGLDYKSPSKEFHDDTPT